MQEVTMSVPYNYGALKRAEEFFKGMAADMPEAKIEDPVHISADIQETKKDSIVEVVAAPSPQEVAAPETSVAAVFNNVAEQVAAPNTQEVAAPAPVGEVDVNGMPWDVRIHAGTKTKTVDGAWKNKRGVAAELRAQIEAELKGAPAQPAAAPITQEVAPAPIETAPITPAPVAASSIKTFAALIAAVTGSNGTIGADAVLKACSDNGVASLPLLATQPEAVIVKVATALGI